MATEISYIVAFTAGLLSFFSPCVLPLVPVYIANLAGTTAVETTTRKSWLPTLLHSLAFVMGFSILFIILGASAGIVGQVIRANAVLLRQIASIIIILFGIFLIASYWIPWLNYEKRLTPTTSSNPGYLRSILIGAAFALGWTPCIGPILGAILTYAWTTQEIWKSAALLTFYSLGLGIPFILIGLAWGAIMPLWKGINRHLGTISIISGALLIIFGVLMLTGNLSWFSQFA